MQKFTYVLIFFLFGITHLNAQFNLLDPLEADRYIEDFHYGRDNRLYLVSGNHLEIIDQGNKKKIKLAQNGVNIKVESDSVLVIDKSKKLNIIDAEEGVRKNLIDLNLRVSKIHVTSELDFLALGKNGDLKKITTVGSTTIDENVADFQYLKNEQELIIAYEKSVKINSDKPRTLRLDNYGSIRLIEINNDETRLFIGTSNSEFIVVDLETLEILSEHVFTGQIKDIDISIDNKYAAVGTSTEKFHIVNLETRSTIFTKKMPRSGEVMKLEFKPDGEELLVKNIFDRNIRRFDVTHLNITPASFIRDENDRNPPQIYVRNPRLFDDLANVYRPTVFIEGLIIDDYGVKQLFVNGIETPVNQQGNFKIFTSLAAGMNDVEIKAYDINDNMALKKFKINRKDENAVEYDPNKGRNHLLVIGINDYEEFPTLNNAVNDANKISKVLSSYYDFEISDIEMVVNEEATRENIYNTLREYVGKLGPNDNLLIYYSGHGIFDELLNEGYWIPVNGKKNSPSTFISNTDILKIVKRINAQHIMLVADACFSGSLFNQSGRGFADNVEKYKSRWALASGRLETVWDGEPGQNSPFTSAFIDFLTNSKKEKITASEIVQHVKITVPEISDQTPIGNPLKNAGDEGGEFVFRRSSGLD